VNDAEESPVNLHQVTSCQPIIPGVIQNHLEEFQFLYGQYEQALHSPDYRLSDLDPLEKRIAAHLDGILVAGDTVLPLLDEGLAGEKPGLVFSAAYVLLRMNAEAAKRVFSAFLQAKGSQLAGIRRALCQSPLGTMVNQLQEAVVASSAPVGVAAAEVLAFHRNLRQPAKRLSDFLHDENPEVRCGAWRVMATSRTVAAR
jgi:uncharacterized protein (TIGR02270 family)